MRPAAAPKDVRPPDLDAVDRRILLALHADARISNSALADAVGIAASTCHGRLRRLQDLGVIRAFYTDIDPAAVGLTLQAMISVSLQSNARGRIRDFIACAHPQKADVVADYVAAVMSGMSADARAGHPPERLAAVADMAALAIRAMLEPTPA